MTVATSLDEEFRAYLAGGCLGEDGPYFAPLAFYRRLREEQPVYRSAAGFWFLTRYEDAVSVLRSDGGAGSPWTKEAANASVPTFMSGSGFLGTFFHTELHHRDGRQHLRLRKALSKVFTPGAIERMRGQTRELIEQKVASLAPRGEMDLVADLALWVPTTVILTLLGIPLDEFDRMNEMARWVIHSQEPTAIGDSSWVRRADATFAERHQYLLSLIEERRREPADDLLSRLAHATDDRGERLSDLELTMNISFLVVAGFETTANSIASGLHLLLTHPDAYRALRDDRSLLPTTVDEVLRFSPAVRTSSARWALEDYEIGGQVIRQGDLVKLSLMAANRDPAEFSDPDRFDITRAPNRHLAFAPFSVHYCLGAALARMELQETFDVVLDRLPGLQPAGRAVPYKRSFVVYGPQKLPVRW